MAGDYSRVAVIGAGGGIGSALVGQLEKLTSVDRVYALARRPLTVPPKARWIDADVTDENSIIRAAQVCGQDGPLQLVVATTGILHDDDKVQPEKSWRSLDGDQLRRVFEINTIAPALLAKHFLPLLDQKRRAIFACLSARVGSISDNRLGGWYAYRASKAALNMLIKSLAIELRRSNKSALCLGLHPGTVATRLSEPFCRNRSPDTVFTPLRAAEQLLKVMDASTEAQSGCLLAWDGTEIQP